jgi:hypothetical protein
MWQYSIVEDVVSRRPSDVNLASRERAPATLRYWRSVGDCGPKSFKLGRRVLYRRADVERWIAAGSVRVEHAFEAPPPDMQSEATEK